MSLILKRLSIAAIVLATVTIGLEAQAVPSQQPPEQPAVSPAVEPDTPEPIPVEALEPATPEPDAVGVPEPATEPDVVQAPEPATPDGPDQLEGYLLPIHRISLAESWQIAPYCAQIYEIGAFQSWSGPGTPATMHCRRRP